MADYLTLKSAISRAIRTNGNNEITGNLLQQQMLAIVNSFGVGFLYMGMATPATNPGTPDQNVFYFAIEAGTYSNMGGFVVNENELAIFTWSGSWSCNKIPISGGTSDLTCIEDPLVDVPLTSNMVEKLKQAMAIKVHGFVYHRISISDVSNFMPSVIDHFHDIRANHISAIFGDYEMEVTSSGGLEPNTYSLYILYNSYEQEDKIALLEL